MNISIATDLNERNANTYDGLSKAFHWLTAIAVIAAFTLGPGDFGDLMQQGIDPGTRNDIVWHESLGLLVFTLTFLRLIWVILRPAAPKFGMATWMRWLSRLMHVALWAMLFALPLSALLALGSEGHPLTLLGGLRITEFSFIQNARLKDLVDWGELHKVLGDVVVWLAGLHAFVAIYHHIKLKDEVLTSMLPL